MAPSSSATRMLPGGMESSSGRAGRLGVGEHGHQHAKDRMPRLRFAFDDATVISDDLGDQREPEPTASRLRGDERIKQMRQEIVGHARATIFDAELEWQG